MMYGLDKCKTKEEAVSLLIQKGIAFSRKDAEKCLFANLPKESYYQKKIIEYLKKRYPSAFVWKAAAGAYSRQGIPDVCAVIDGRYFGFEVKRPLVGVLSVIQEKTIEKIRAAGGCAGVVTFPEDAQKMITEASIRKRIGSTGISERDSLDALSHSAKMAVDMKE